LFLHFILLSLFLPIDLILARTCLSDLQDIEYPQLILLLSINHIS
jgi:hypothetical protein